MSSFLLHAQNFISGCKPRHRRLILRGPMALKEASAPEAVAPNFPLRAGRTSRSTPESRQCHVF
jgi:hypothetical protein